MTNEFEVRLARIESILQKALPKTADKDWIADTFSTVDSAIQEQHFAGLIEPCAHLVSLGGKRWRPLLLVLCAELAAEHWLSLARGETDAKAGAAACEHPAERKHRAERAVETAYNLVPLVEFAHTASLIHDDIEDAADTRRGAPAAHITYGMDTAINAGSWLYFAATACIETQALSVAEKNTFYALYLLELRRLHLGQAMDILWHRNPALIPTEDEYRAMVRNKTGTLARMAVKIGMTAGGATATEAEAAGKIAEDIGVGFQILDDVTNLTTGNPGKKRGDDIVEGKKSLPVLIHLQKHPEDRETLAALFEEARRDGILSPAVEKAITLLTESGAVAEAEAQGAQLVAEMSRKLATFFDGATKDCRAAAGNGCGAGGETSGATATGKSCGTGTSNAGAAAGGATAAAGGSAATSAGALIEALFASMQKKR